MTPLKQLNSMIGEDKINLQQKIRFNCSLLFLSMPTANALASANSFFPKSGWILDFPAQVFFHILF